jgi:hypothetical protein
VFSTGSILSYRANFSRRPVGSIYLEIGSRKGGIVDSFGERRYPCHLNEISTSVRFTSPLRIKYLRLYLDLGVMLGVINYDDKQRYLASIGAGGGCDINIDNFTLTPEVFIPFPWNELDLGNLGVTVRYNVPTEIGTLSFVGRLFLKNEFQVGITLRR